MTKPMEKAIAYLTRLEPSVQDQRIPPVAAALSVR